MPSGVAVFLAMHWILCNTVYTHNILQVLCCQNHCSMKPQCANLRASEDINVAALASHVVTARLLHHSFASVLVEADKV